MVVDVSAKKRIHLDLLLEMILLVADIGELKANPKRNASGTVLEAKLDRGRGPVATILVQDGTLHVGDTFIAGPIVGRVRALIDDRGHQIKRAGPSTPVEVLGLGGLPQPGDAFQALADAAKARQVAMYRQTQAKEKALGAKGGRLTLESLQQQIAEGNIKELPILIKADVQGSAEVLADSLTNRSASASFTPASGRSTSRTCCWHRRRTPSSSASTSARTAMPRRWRNASMSTSACIR